MVTAKIRQSPRKPADERRRELLAAAARLFSKKGYRATTTDEIARAAGLTKGALYHHFKSKEDVLYELVVGFMDQYKAGVDERLSEHPTAEEFIDAQLDLTCSDNMGDYQLHVDIFVQSWKIPRLKRLMNRRIREYVDDMTERLTPPDGVSKSKLRDLIVAVLSLRDGLSVVAILAPSLIDIQAQRKILNKMFQQTVN